ncbi:large conductance mechanosensitive channel protein MscL [Cyanobacterium stanieri LEGE 03274]|uniref:Large-conductance mechanosensitive channel n=1 Tax=Cyanobacterium stanieri LEGE 03274 TaxID=1828756 RepID=A0ABR9V4J2_9CHRO|nr:large conductance mechanosensitive channel protein MscL [Cyanobacterium stanieri]MBE9221749.1 large conductance mechanosensitive channel protein MscL [Cyanobacterium stanieri LEGE 03274]
MTTNNNKSGIQKFIADFRAFIMRGNVIDLAVAVVIGAAFGRIVNSLVEDVITPLILNPAIEAAGVSQLEELSYGAVKYGLFLSAIINFLVIAFCLFLVIRSFESLKRKLERKQQIAEAEAEAVAEEEVNPEIVVQENLIKAIEKLTETMNQKG